MNRVEALRSLFDSPDAERLSLSFARRAEPIPGDLRLAWRLVILCMIVDRGRGGKASMQAAHVLWWAVRSPRTRSLFLRWMDGQQSPDEMLVRFDPTLTETMDLAVGAGLVEVDHNANLILLPRGKELAADAWEAAGVLQTEKEFFAALPKKISQKAIRDLLEWK